MTAGDGGGENLPVEPPQEVLAWGQYIYTVASWTKDGVLSVTWMNRVQNESVVTECRSSSSTSSWQCLPVFRRSSPTGWLELFSAPIYSRRNRNRFLQILPSLQPSSQLTFKHVAMVDTGGDDNNKEEDNREEEEVTFL